MASEVFGSLVAAISVNLVLYTLEFVLACILLASKSEEGLRISARLRVCLNIIIDGAATATGCAFLYMFQGSHWGENDDVQARYWRIVIGVLIVGTVSTAIAQSYLLERFWKNIRHHLLGTTFAVAILVLAVFTSVAAIVVCAYLQWTNATIIVPFVWAAVICNVIATLGITTVSVCQRFALRTITPKNHIIVRAWRAFIETGLPSSIIAVLALAAWAAGQKGAFVIGLYFIQARVYSCTMIFALRNPLPPRGDGWIEEMIANSAVQKRQPAPPATPDIYLNNEKASRLSLGDIPEEKQSWYNIDLGSGAVDSEEATMGPHRAAFYQVAADDKK
ncbi:hypothetical protein B0H12DRAFT_1142502 [Mycena haematopus]|nr:hypothetical protein B0H12DRAFT_1142502 [Mycena haematopus]